MIRYDISPRKLRTLVKQRVPGWIERAQKRTESFRNLKKYKEKSSIWSEVKPVFMDVQGGAKCCFCERKFEGTRLGRYELDIEHYRPKGNVKKWICPQKLVREGVKLSATASAGSGYHLLSYHLRNYAVACKSCNSGLKKDYFPISGPYDLNGDDPTKMKKELPWLLYPIGRLDIDPEEVITFYGYLPQSKSTKPHLRLRGLVTIFFFGLDDVFGRKTLLKERAWVIISLHLFLVEAEDNKNKQTAALVQEILKPSSRHTNCARSFKRLFHSDRTKAAEVARLAEEYILSRSP